MAFASFRARCFDSRRDISIPFVPRSKNQIYEGFFPHDPPEFSPREERNENAEHDDAAPG